MWSMKDVYVANERYADIRRAAEKHNAVTRLSFEQQEKQRDEKQPKKIWESVRKVLR